jgi:hypothetical protein
MTMSESSSLSSIRGFCGLIATDLEPHDQLAWQRQIRELLPWENPRILITDLRIESAIVRPSHQIPSSDGQFGSSADGVRD